jgi:hypothetical protein
MIWAMIKDSTSAASFDEYLQTFPNGAHAAAAHAKLVALAERASVPLAPAAPTPAIEGMIWALIKDSTSASPLEEYLQAYPNGDHAAAARARLAELARAPPAATADDGSQMRSRTALSTAPSVALGLDGRWQGDAPVTPYCGPARMQLEVAGNRISGTGATGTGAGRAASNATISGTIGPDGRGTIEWGRGGPKGTIEFADGRFEAHVFVCEARAFAGGRTQ